MGNIFKRLFGGKKSKPKHEGIEGELQNQKIKPQEIPELNKEKEVKVNLNETKSIVQDVPEIQKPKKAPTTLKEGTEQSIDEVIDETFISQIEAEGFKYLEKQRKFRFEKGDFKVEISIKPEIDRIHLNEHDDVRFNVRLMATFFSSKYRSWFKKNMKGLPQALHFHFVGKNFIIYDKSFDSNRHNENELNEIKSFLFDEVKSVFEKLNSWDNILSNFDLIQRNTDLENIYLFLGRNEEASKLIKERRAKALSAENGADKYSHLISCLNFKLVNIIGEEPTLPKVEFTIRQEEKEHQVNDKLILKSEYKISGLPKHSMISISKNGEYFASVHNNGLALIWKSNGELLYQKNLINKRNETKMDQISAGFILDKNLFHLDQYFYSLSSGELSFKIELQNEKKKKENLRLRHIYFLAKRKEIIAVFENNNIGLFDLNGSLKSRFVTEGDIVKVLQTTGEMVVYSDKKYLFIDDKNNIQREFKTLTNNSVHELSEDESLFFVGGYYTKQYLYDLKSNKSTVVWAHPTHKKEYKELFATVCHNFGCNKAAFSPDGSKLALTADHGRNSIFETAKLERTEFKTREKFDYEWHKVEFSYGLMSINFYSSDIIFTTINNLLVVWDQNGNEMLEIPDVWNATINKKRTFILCTDREGNLTRYNLN